MFHINKTTKLTYLRYALLFGLAIILNQYKNGIYHVNVMVNTFSNVCTLFTQIQAHELFPCHM